MKKSIKRLITVFAVCAVSAMAVMFTGCSMTDKIKEKIDQVRCEHEWNDGEVTKEATCTEVGELTKTCTLCAKVETEEIPLIEHTEVVVAAVSPTCTKDGLASGVKCDVCDKVIVEQIKIPALGHFESKDVPVAPTCLTAGKTEGSHCCVCNEVLTAQMDIPATGHMVVIIEGKAPTCTTEGMTNGSKCATCDETLLSQTVISALGHTPMTVKGKAATCTENGLTDGEKCSTCDMVLAAQTVIVKAEHNAVTTQEAVSATCTTEGKTQGTACSECGEDILISSTIPALGHKVVTDSAVAVTCVTNGKTEGSHCSRCYEVLVAQTVIPATGHDIQLVSAVAPTCTMPGVEEGSQCLMCGEVFDGESIPALGHIDENRDGSCDNCGTLMTDLVQTASFEIVENGDTLSSGWYRVATPSEYVTLGSLLIGSVISSSETEIICTMVPEWALSGTLDGNCFLDVFSANSTSSGMMIVDGVEYPSFSVVGDENLASAIIYEGYSYFYLPASLNVNIICDFETEALLPVEFKDFSYQSNGSTIVLEKVVF